MIRSLRLGSNFDLIFEINSLRSMGLKYYEFIDLVRPFLRKGGIIFLGEADEFITFEEQGYKGA